MTNITISAGDRQVTCTSDELQRFTNELTSKTQEFSEVVDVSDLKNTVEKLERLEDEKAMHTEVVKEAYAEAKAKGYCAKTLKHVLKLRKKDRAKIDEEDALMELYRGALDI